MYLLIQSFNLVYLIKKKCIRAINFDANFDLIICDVSNSISKAKRINDSKQKMNNQLITTEYMAESDRTYNSCFIPSRQRS